MSDRLIKALERGGIAVRLKDDSWGIWRGRDQRGRRIGTLPGSEISAQVGVGHLAPFGEPSEQRLVWSGPPMVRDSIRPSPNALYDEPAGTKPKSLTLLQRVLEACQVPKRRERWVSAVREFANTVELAEAYGAPGGMNWSAMETGGRIDSTRKPGNGLARQQLSQQARQRLQTISQKLSPEAFDLLNMMILRQCSRHAAHRRFGGTLPDLHKRARLAIRQLADTLDNDVKRS